MSAPSFAAIAPGRLAVVTSGASGIGLAAVRTFAAGMRVVLVDSPGNAFNKAAASIAAGSTAFAVDVADRAAMVDLAGAIADGMVARSGGCADNGARRQGDFYILCPDNEATVEQDRECIA